MKYLKTHKTFESNSWIREEVKDLFSNLEDEGYTIRCSHMGGGAGYIVISKMSGATNPQLQFNLYDIKSEVVRAIDFLSDRYVISITATIGAMSNKRNITIDQLKHDKESGKPYPSSVHLSLPDKVRMLQIDLYPNTFNI